FLRAAVHAERGRDDLERARACATLGYTLGYYRQRFDEAYRWLELAVATYQRIPSPEDEGEALNLWVSLLLEEGKDREALAMLERLEKLIRVSLPPDDPLAFRAHLKRVQLLLDFDRPQEAIEVAREAVAMAIKRSGAGHPAVAAARLQLANG